RSAAQGARLGLQGTAEQNPVRTRGARSPALATRGAMESREAIRRAGPQDSGGGRTPAATAGAGREAIRLGQGERTEVRPPAEARRAASEGQGGGQRVGERPATRQERSRRGRHRRSREPLDRRAGVEAARERKAETASPRGRVAQTRDRAG